MHSSLGAELTAKVNELRLVLANHISDKVIDDVIDGLAKSYKGLIGGGGGGDMGSFKKKRSLTPDVLKVGTYSTAACLSSHILEHESSRLF